MLFDFGERKVLIKVRLAKDRVCHMISVLILATCFNQMVEISSSHSHVNDPLRHMLAFAYIYIYRRNILTSRVTQKIYSKLIPSILF
jgi:hypothetical protein